MYTLEARTGRRATAQAAKVSGGFKTAIRHHTYDDTFSLCLVVARRVCARAHQLFVNGVTQVCTRNLRAYHIQLAKHNIHYYYYRMQNAARSMKWN